MHDAPSPRTPVVPAPGPSLVTVRGAGVARRLPHRRRSTRRALAAHVAATAATAVLAAGIIAVLAAVPAIGTPAAPPVRSAPTAPLVPAAHASALASLGTAAAARGTSVAPRATDLPRGVPTGVETAAALAEVLADTTGDVAWSLAPADGPLGAGRANFSYDVAPGDVVHDAVVVTNRSDAPLTLTVYGTDAFTTPAGHLDLLTADEEPADLGAWLALDVPGGQVVVEPRASTTVPFVLTVPADAAPGDHAGGVVTSFLSAATGSTVARDNRLALRVHARVAGDLAPGLSVRDVRVRYEGTADPFGVGRTVVTYRLVNTGNARLLPAEAVTVAGPGDVGARTSPVTALPEVLAGSSLEREVVLPGVRPTVRLTADVAVTGEVVGIGGGDTAADRSSAATWAVPWTLLVVVLLVVAGAVAVPLVRSRGRTGEDRAPRS